MAISASSLLCGRLRRFQRRGGVSLLKCHARFRPESIVVSVGAYLFLLVFRQRSFRLEVRVLQEEQRRFPPTIDLRYSTPRVPTAAVETGVECFIRHALGHVLYQSARGIRLRRPHTPVGNAYLFRSFTPGGQDILNYPLGWSFGYSLVVANHQSDCASARVSGRGVLCHRCGSTSFRSNG